MQRRSFLKSAAAVLPAAGLPAFALEHAAQANPGTLKEGHVILAGHDRLEETHSLGFSRILFKVLPRETSSGLFVIEHQNLVKGGPSLHLHFHQEEWFYVMEGEVDFQVGEKRFRLGPGDSAFGPRGIPHTFSHVGATPGRMLICFTPAGKMEEFFRAVAIPNGPGMTPEMFARYDMQYIGPSPFA
jgi:mannose-6-phosphate isomerase-like protein (cupin superfamily)